MTGYDDEKQCIYVNDCGIDGTQEISYEELALAWDIEKTSLSDKNGFFKIRWDKNITSVKDLCFRCFAEKAETNLNSPVGFLGIRGLRKLASEIDHWNEELSEEDYKASLMWLLMFCGTVPQYPNRIFGIQEPDKIEFKAARERLVEVFTYTGNRFHVSEWVEAARYFEQSGNVIARLALRLTDYLTDTTNALEPLHDLFMEIADLEEKAYQCIQKGASRHEL